MACIWAFVRKDKQHIINERNCLSECRTFYNFCTAWDIQYVRGTGAAFQWSALQSATVTQQSLDALTHKQMVGLLALMHAGSTAGWRCSAETSMETAGSVPASLIFQATSHHFISKLRQWYWVPGKEWAHIR